MAKSTGLAMSLAVDDSGSVARTISNDVTNLQWATPRGVQDTTGIDKSAMERLLLLADMSVTLNGVLNPAASPAAHGVFRTVPSTSVARTTTITIAGVVLAGSLLYTDYSLTRAQSGEATWTAPGVLASGTVPTWA
jgi:hypothetical protein